MYAFAQSFPGEVATIFPISVARLLILTFREKSTSLQKSTRLSAFDSGIEAERVRVFMVNPRYSKHWAGSSTDLLKFMVNQDCIINV